MMRKRTNLLWETLQKDTNFRPQELRPNTPGPLFLTAEISARWPEATPDLKSKKKGSDVKLRATSDTAAEPQNKKVHHFVTQGQNNGGNRVAVLSLEIPPALTERSNGTTRRYAERERISFRCVGNLKTVQFSEGGSLLHRKHTRVQPILHFKRSSTMQWRL